MQLLSVFLYADCDIASAVATQAKAGAVVVACIVYVALVANVAALRAYTGVPFVYGALLAIHRMLTSVATMPAS